MDKQNVAYTHNRILLSLLKKKEILVSAMTWIKLEDIILSKISQLPNNKYFMIPLI